MCEGGPSLATAAGCHKRERPDDGQCKAGKTGSIHPESAGSVSGEDGQRMTNGDGSLLLGGQRLQWEGKDVVRRSPEQRKSRVRRIFEANSRSV